MTNEQYTSLAGIIDRFPAIIDSLQTLERMNLITGYFAQADLSPLNPTATIAVFEVGEDSSEPTKFEFREGDDNDVTLMSLETLLDKISEEAVKKLDETRMKLENELDKVLASIREIIPSYFNKR